MQARVRVVIVNYNAGPLLLDCVRRAVQSSLPVEVRVVDNASSDGSIEALSGAGLDPEKLTIVANADNLGFAAACNQGLSGWKGDYALLLNPDCLVEADTIERMMSLLDSHPEAGMAGCLVLNPDGTEQRGCRRHRPSLVNALKLALGGKGFNLANSPLPEQVVPVDAISGAFMMVRESAMTEVGLLDEGYFMHCEDLDWCRRFHSAGWTILFDPTVQVRHDKGTCSTGKPVEVEWHKHKGMLRYYRKFLWPHYPRVLGVLIYPAVLIRFGVKSLAHGLARFFRRR